jgi:hypothetical protein
MNSRVIEESKSPAFPAGDFKAMTGEGGSQRKYSDWRRQVGLFTTCQDFFYAEID